MRPAPETVVTLSESCRTTAKVNSRTDPLLSRNLSSGFDSPVAVVYHWPRGSKMLNFFLICALTEDDAVADHSTGRTNRHSTHVTLIVLPSMLTEGR